jgi:hypothetical protein
MFETIKALYLCTIFYAGVDGQEVENSFHYFQEIALFENKFSDENKVLLTEYYTEKLVPQTPWVEQYKQESQYIISKNGNYYFETMYEETTEDEETLEISTYRGRIEHAINPETLRYKQIFNSIDEEGVEQEDAEPDYGYCIQITNE